MNSVGEEVRWAPSPTIALINLARAGYQPLSQLIRGVSALSSLRILIMLTSQLRLVFCGQMSEAV